MTIIYGTQAPSDALKKMNAEDGFISETYRHHACLFQSIFFQSIRKKAYITTQKEAIYEDNQSKIAIIADARLFNRTHLLESLSLPVLTDSQLILRAYQKWGIDCVHHLIGDFAFAIHDATKKHIFLACDPLGQRSLFYHHAANGDFCFSNLLKPLFDVGIKKSFNRDKIADYLALLTANIHHTFFKDIHRLPAAHYLILDPYTRRMDVKRYWSATEVHHQPLHFDSSEACYNQFSELYHTIINDQLQLIDGNVGCHLSGGLDSSSVAAVAASLLKKQNKKLITFSHVPNRQRKQNFNYPLTGYNYDDSVFIEAISNQYDNIALNYIRDQDKPFFCYNDMLHRWLDFPCTNPSNLPWFMTIVEQAMNKNIHVILTGIGGNFTLSWNGLPETKKISLLRKLKRNVTHLETFFTKRLLGQRKNAPWRYFASINGELATQSGLLDRYFEQSYIAGKNLLSDRRLRIFDGGFLENVSCLHTAIRFLYGVEHWDPTLDKRLVEFCLRIPNDMFINKKGTRLLVREGLQPLLPALVRQRTSHGMQAAEWYDKFDQQKQDIHQHLYAWKKTNIQDYIDLDPLIKLMKRWDYHKIANSQNRQYNYYNCQFHVKLLRAVEVGLFLQHHIGER